MHQRKIASSIWVLFFGLALFATVGSLVASGPQTLFTFTTSGGKVYVGYFDADGSSILTFTDETNNQMKVKAEDISSGVLTKRKGSGNNMAPCYDEKAVVTLGDKTTIEGCFRPYHMTFISGKVSMEVSSLTGSFVRKKD
ncbi:MAG TPA: hypothetical protein VNX26_02445 [Candidatus Acidoferrum sp.]|jgi:hypothetical protein|nr:hypothetical protein [Candidatus Acidoferrum sp.]